MLHMKYMTSGSQTLSLIIYGNPNSILILSTNSGCLFSADFDCWNDGRVLSSEAVAAKELALILSELSRIAISATDES